jgi:hypothetical protein
MARVTGKNGAVTFLTGVAADFNSWRLGFNHPVDDDTSYTDTGSGASHSGSLTVDYTLGATGFLKSNVASTAPGWGGTAAAIASAAGSVTLTAHTGCTEAGSFVLTGGSIDHRKRAGAIPVSYDGINDGDLTETWAVS